MIKQYSAKLIYLMLLLALTGCRQAPTPCTLSKNQRTQYLQQMQSWQITGRISVTRGQENTTASFTWQQTNEHYKIHFYSAFSSDTLTIVGDKHSFKATSNADASDLALEHIPFQHLSQWLKGNLATTNIIKESYDRYNQLQTLQQDGWLIEYQSYANTSPVSLPEKMTLSDGTTKTKLIIKNWQK